MEYILVWMMASCFVLAGVATGAFFVYRIFQGFTSNRWPFAIGELESTELKEVIYNGRDAGGGVDLASAWVVNFKYSYSVSDSKYAGSRVTYSDGINKTSRALKQLQKRYQGKSLIQVYYNPENPKQSVLVPGLGIFNFTPLITSGLFILAGLFIYSYDGKL
jgi:hypothetical protein